MKKNGVLHLNKRSQSNLILEIGGYVSSQTKNEEIKGYIRLDLGENLVSYNPNIQKSLKELDNHVFQHYADPSASKIKKTISKLLKCDPKQILIGNSSDELINFVANISLEEDDTASIVHPNFFRYIEATMMVGAKINDIFCSEDENYAYTDRVVDLLVSSSAEHNSKLIWLSNPINPTGNLVSQELLLRIIQNTEATVVIDEAFIEFCDPEVQLSSIELTRKYENVLVLRTLSKAYGLAGVRFAYLIGHPNSIEKLTKLRTTLSMTSGLSQYLANVAFLDKKWIKKSTEEINYLRSELFRKIRALESFVLGGDSLTNVYLLRHKTKNLYQELKKRGILVSDFSEVKGLENKGYARITVGTAKQNETLLTNLEAIS